MADWLNWATVAPIAGAGVAAAAGMLHIHLRGLSPGNALMIEAASALRKGGAAFLSSGVRALALPAAAISCLLLWQSGTLAAFAFLWGALLASAAVAAAAEAALRASPCTAQAAREAGRSAASSAALAGGAAGALALAGLGLLGAGAVQLLLRPDAGAAMAAFALGASAVAVFGRLGGGILATASEGGVALLDRMEPGLVLESSHHPAALADRVGQTVGDVAGGAADLFESLAAVLAATAVLALAGPPGVGAGARLSFALAVALLGVLGATAAALPLALFPRWARLLPPRLAAAVPVGLTTLGAFGLAGPLRVPTGAALAAALGALAAPALAAATRHYASRRPVRRVAESAQLGAAANVLAGLAAGLEGCALPILLLAGAMLAALHAAGPYGAGLCALGMTASAGFFGALQAVPPIVANARRIAGAANLGSDAGDVLEVLDAEGAQQAALGRGFAAGTAVLAALALLAAYFAASGLKGIDLSHPGTLAGLLVGAAIPFVVSALALTSAADAAFELVSAARCHLRAAAGTEARLPDPMRAAADAALRRAVVPGLTAVVVPLTVGLTLGAEALGGTLAGTVASGSLLAFFFADAGDVWRGSRRLFEGGALGGAASEAYRAARVGDAVGEPLKDSAGPAVHSLLKTMAAASLVLGPLLPG